MFVTGDSKCRLVVWLMFSKKLKEKKTRSSGRGDWLSAILSCCAEGARSEVCKGLGTRGGRPGGGGTGGGRGILDCCARTPNGLWSPMTLGKTPPPPPVTSPAPVARADWNASAA